jgi:PAS domain S-box-containing protein
MPDLSLTKIREFPEMNFLIKKFNFDKKNDLWMLMNNLLFCFDFSEKGNFNSYREYVFDFHNGLPNSKLLNFFNFDDKLVIVSDSGLYYTDIKEIKSDTLTFKHLSGIDKDLENNIVFAYTHDKKNYYFLTNNYVFKYNKANQRTEKFSFPQYYELNSVALLSFDGCLFFNNNQNVYCLDTNFYSNNITTNFFIRLRSYCLTPNPPEYVYNSEKNIQIQDSIYKINIRFSSKANIEFIFYSNILTSDLTYFYKFIDESEDWQKLSSNILIFRHLRPGKHTVEIKAIDNNGNESSSIFIELKVKRKKYFTIAALIGYFILFSILVWIIARYRVKAIKRQKNALKAALLQREKMLEQKQEEIKLQAENLKKQKKLLDRESNKLQAATIELQQLSLVAQKTSNSVIIIDKKGKFEWVNRVFADMFHYKIEKYKNLPLKSAHKKIRPDIYKEIAFFTPDKGTLSYTNHEIFDNGEEIWYQTTIYPFLDDNGEISKFVVIDINITDLKLYERKFQNQNDINKLLKEELNEHKANLRLAKEDLNYLINEKQINFKYAQFLHNSTNTDCETLKNIFEETFVLNLPIDKISGDFYWATETDNNIFVAFGDASGHNIHGAIMSAVAIALIKEIILKNSNADTDIILSIFNNKIFDLLQKNNKDKDIIQMILLKIDKKSKKINISSSKIPLIIVRNKSKFIKIASNRIDLGFKKDYKFASQTFDTIKNDRFYLITDGWPYQFGKFGQKKYSSKGIEKFLLSIQNQNFENHKDLINNEIKNWRGNFQQTDDILVLGFSLKILF